MSARSNAPIITSRCSRDFPVVQKLSGVGEAFGDHSWVVIFRWAGGHGREKARSRAQVTVMHVF